MNLALACASCNLAKSDHVGAIEPKTGEMAPLFNPRLDHWGDHFVWLESDFKLSGLTSVGRATVASLNMNSNIRLLAREIWFELGLLP